MTVARPVQAQDLVPTPAGTPTLRHGVAAARRMSVEEAERRHGRKSRSLRVEGYKRHVLRDVDSRLIVALGVTPANAPEASVTDALAKDWAAQQCTLREWPIDRASLASPGCTTGLRRWPFSARRGPCVRGRIVRKVPCNWMGSATHCGVPAERLSPLNPAV